MSSNAKYKHLPDNVVNYFGIENSDTNTIYRTVTISKDSKNLFRVHGISFKGQNKNFLMNKNIIIQFDDFREQVGTICYALFDKDDMKKIAKVSKDDGKQLFLEVNDIMNFCTKYVSKYSKNTIQMSLKRASTMDKFEVRGNVYSYGSEA